jgi:hypothetical protein
MSIKDTLFIIAVGSALGYLLTWGLDRQLLAMGY